MLVTERRPRVLKWFHAGPLLYGDWGTSRLYVLGLAFFFTAHASVIFLGAIGVLMAVVAWAYTVICRCFPDGGGVYTAARQVNPVVGIVGGTLLLGGYIVTTAISVVVAFRYFGVPREVTPALSVITILAIGVVNWFGARNAGRFALVIAVTTLGVSLVVAVLSLRFVGDGLRTISLGDMPPPGRAWVAFAHICLAMSGIEAVANMTGLMRRPVARTAHRTIWPVLIEVVTLNMVFGLALAGLPALLGVHAPDAATYAGVALPDSVVQYRDAAMRLLATESGRAWLGEEAGAAVGTVAGAVFGLLLLSAANTAIMVMVSVLYSMAQDRELPRPLTRLNYSGVPWVGLVAACAAPAVAVVLEQDVEVLAALYVVCVCGAITTNILSCAANRALPIAVWERGGMFAVGTLLLAITMTILLTERDAAAFAAGLTGTVLTLRYGRRRIAEREAPPVPEPERGWLAVLREKPVEIDPSRPRIMLAARGRYQAEFAVDLARRRGATLFAIYVRTLRVVDLAPGAVPKLEDDEQAVESLGYVALLSRQYRVPFVPIYVASADIAEEILDYTVTFGCDTLILGKTRRRAFARALEGDVVTKIAQNLPDGVALITREPTPHPLPPPPEPEATPDGGAAAPAEGPGREPGATDGAEPPAA